jgi:NADH-quinone oxidoreductase subunit G/NADP-reducing hydrogenase subunit HndD
VQFPELEALIHAKNKIVVAQYSPVVAISVAEMLGFKPGTDLSGLIHAVLRRYGFDYVFETSLGAEIMIMEQSKLFADRQDRPGGFPLITSSCPAWVQYVEQYYPDLIPQLSPLKSSQQLTGSLIKMILPAEEDLQGKDVASVLISSCTAAKSEARRVEMSRSGVPVVDLVLTTRELARLIRLSGLDLEQLEAEASDPPFHSPGTAGKMTGVAGGEVEATMRTLYQRYAGSDITPAKLHRFRIHKPYREMTVKAGRIEIRMAMVSGLAHALPVLEEVRCGKKQLDILEIMACPGGCVNGGGQPLPVDDSLVRTRTRAVYDLDNGGTIQTAHHNPQVIKIYEDFLGSPGGEVSREHLYTTFSEREVL